jgi:hypothetical protein
MAKRKRNVPATSKAISQQQAWVTYAPAKRLRNQALSTLEAAKLEAAISNDPSHGWERTSNLKIHISKTVYYYIVIKLREKKDATKGSRKYSKGYPSLFVAEEAAF